MRSNTRNLFSMLAGVLASALFSIATVHAAELRESTPSYPQDSSNNIIRSGTGDCAHTGSWTSSDATVVGCDGVTQRGDRSWRNA